MGNAVGTIGKIVDKASLPNARAGNKRMLAGILKQLYGIDEEGNASFMGGLDWKPNPGLIDEVLAMGTLLPDRYVPEVSKKSQENVDKLNDLINEQLGIEEAHGLKERSEEALGTMLSQGPVGVTREAIVQSPSAIRKIGRGLGTAAEWFTPTVEARLPNYLAGTATGGALGAEADHLSDAVEGNADLNWLDRALLGLMKPKNPDDLSRAINQVDSITHKSGGGLIQQLHDLGRKYAEGGKVSGLKMLLKLAAKQGFDDEDLKVLPEALHSISDGDPEGLAQSILDSNQPKDLKQALSEVLDDHMNNIMDQRATGMMRGRDGTEPPMREMIAPPAGDPPDFGRRPGPEDQQRLIDFHNAFSSDVRRRALGMGEAIKKVPWKYKIGDRVQGSLPVPYEVIGYRIDKKHGPLYQMRTVDGEQEFEMPELGIRGAFTGPKKFGKGGEVSKLAEALRALKASMAEKPQTEVYKSLSDLSDQHEVPVSQIMKILEQQPDPSIKPLQALIHPTDEQLSPMIAALKSKSLLDEPFDYLNTNLSIPQSERENLATAYAKAINSYHDVMEQPSTEALGIYQQLADQFGQMAAPYKPKE